MEKNPEVRMSLKEHQRLRILEEVKKGNRSQVNAAEVLGVTDRWIRELLKRVDQKGPQGLIHAHRGRESNRRIREEKREQIIQLYQDKYEGFNLTHYREMLEEREGMEAPCRETLRTILLQAGHWKHRRKAPKHRLRRPRRERAGELLQVDASFHAWFGAEQPVVALVGGIDDATGDVPYAGFFEAETTEAYFYVLRETIRRKGVPRAIYGDRDSVFMINNLKKIEEVRTRGDQPQTQFGRGLKELGIEWIAAYSPQAKGRIERLWGTFQDRLLRELRLEGIQTMAKANRYLHQKFLPRYNRKFRRPAAIDDPVYAPAPSNRYLETVLCWKDSRILARDHTFSWQGQTWQVLPSKQIPALTRRKIEVRKTLRGQIQAWYQNIRLKIREVLESPSLASLRSPKGSASRAPASPNIRKAKVLL